eukprot:3670481-Pleurochrysis_carterae.AAC.1
MLLSRLSSKKLQMTSVEIKASGQYSPTTCVAPLGCSERVVEAHKDCERQAASCRETIIRDKDQEDSELICYFCGDEILRPCRKA